MGGVLLVLHKPDQYYFKGRILHLGLFEALCCLIVTLSLHFAKQFAMTFCDMAIF